MHIDSFLPGGLVGAPEIARHAEDAGFEMVWAGEMANDPMLALAAVATGTTKIRLGSGVALAFARSPMLTAQQAWALAEESGGRFTLGLGTQVKPHITRRYSMPWSTPDRRMREYIHALRHIWDIFQNGGRLNFHGEHYRLDLMHPLFNPGPIATPDIPVALTGVGPKMTRLAGELADGYLLHPFTNTAYMKKVTLPALNAGLSAAGRSRADIWIFGYAFLAIGDTEESQAIIAERARAQIAFYAATPMYRGVLEAIGYADAQPELERLIRAQRTNEIASVVDDGMLDHFVLRGTLEELPGRIRARYGREWDRVASYYPIFEAEIDRVRQFTAAFRGGRQP